MSEAKARLAGWFAGASVAALLIAVPGVAGGWRRGRACCRPCPCPAVPSSAASAAARTSGTSPASAVPSPSAGGAKSGPTLLFDGKSLGQWKPSGFFSQGRVEVKDEALVIGAGDGCSGITWTGEFPTLNYEITLEAQRVDGTDFFCGLTFPVELKKGEVSPCTLICGGWGGGVVGLSSINGSDASENATTGYREFTSGKWYPIRLRVTREKIEAWIEKDKIVDFAIGDNKLSIRIEVEESKPLGIATYRTTAALRNLRVAPVTGPETPVQPDP